MLEALIRTKDSGLNSDKRRGDIICVKLKLYSSAKNWGQEERRVHRVIPYEDQELETKMMSEMSRTGITPVFITPYKKTEITELFDESGNSLGIFEITKTRSQKYLDIDSIPEESDFKKIIEAGNTQLLRSGDLKDYFKNKTEEEISQEFEQNKQAFLSSFISA